MEWCVVVMLLVATSTLVAAEGSGHGGGESGNGASINCVNELAPCLYYLNGNGGGRGRGRGDDDEPGESCCEPLKEVIKKEGECLCSLISNEGSAQAEQAGINMTLAQQLPSRCGQHVNPIYCLDLRQGTTSQGGDSDGHSTNNNNTPNSAITILLWPCWKLFLYLIHVPLRFLWHSTQL
ncbi:hypothetical protein TIFTF001_056362 [Ficus carica]|uniref:Bifunctional inhibitor/plant lipid transfer protein/seed storage helical domain-containing protein n=1 Tax=Ficus carica TaxID=3494 RepID=A0AA88EJ13_FICCA|nr:hypothetical protein TIFTF001_056362 [Ficus carica]